MTKVVPIVAALTLVGVVGFSGPAMAFTGQKYAKEAKITLPEARTIALKAQKGTITDEELERESGGSGLRYSFDIKSKVVSRRVV